MASAKVSSVEAVKEFHATLVKFHDQADKALGEVEMELRRFFNWLEKEQMSYWQNQLRRWQELLTQAKNDLARKQSQRRDGYTPDVSEQKVAVRKAKMRVETCHEKIEAIKRWSTAGRRAVEEYKGQARQLEDLIDGEPAPAVLFMNRVIDRLESYLKVAPVSSAPGAPASASSTASAAEERSQPKGEPEPPAQPGPVEPDGPDEENADDVEEAAAQKERSS